MLMKTMYEEWFSNAKDRAIKEELEKVADDAGAIEDRFFKELSFGTGGLRGKLGAGTNRMNIYTVGRATFGLAEYISKGAKKSVVIAYDSRRMSEEFARLIAGIMSSKGITAYLFDEPTPTPVLSYAVRKLKAGAGVVVTASHNPKEYNGYKVYNEKGCQITDETAAEIFACIRKYGYFNEYRENGEKIHILGEETVESFLDEVLKYSLPCDREYYPSIVYTPLNGTGNKPVGKLFQKMGVKDFTVVPSQKAPDGNFPTCPYPNPEEKEALKEALKCARETGAELVIATDPDADRMGIAVKNGDDYRLLNGNETGVLMENYLLEHKTALKAMPKNPYIVKTIVTTPLAEKIASAYGVGTKEVLTGFKYIGETIDRETDGNYVFGLEESCGYLVGEHARDKDAISAVMTIVEAVCYYKAKGQTLLQALDGIFKKYGYYSAALYYKVFEGADGAECMKKFINKLRGAPFSEICGEKVTEYKDYLQGIDGLPKSDVLSFAGKNFSLIIRPSGTEPKLKIYMTVNGDSEKESRASLEKISTYIKSLL